MESWVILEAVVLLAEVDPRGVFGTTRLLEAAVPTNDEAWLRDAIAVFAEYPTDENAKASCCRSTAAAADKTASDETFIL